jgi:LmbE family N-acetylglucosaminyl deacetylase
MTLAAAIHHHMRNMPNVSLDTMLAGRPALVLAPHPDDESLGCGGFIAAACMAGLAPLVLIVTDGAASHPASRQFPPATLRTLREQEAAQAVSCLGLPRQRLVFLRLPDTAAPTHGTDFNVAVAKIIDLSAHHGCGSILAPWQYDPHCDHEATWMMAMKVAQQTGAHLMAYPVWGWMLPSERNLPGPLPQGVRLNISGQLTLKRAAIAAHRSQHGLVVTDSLEGFVLPPALLTVFDNPYEVFLSAQL